jgi:hypothetical protein
MLAETKILCTWLEHNARGSQRGLGAGAEHRYPPVGPLSGKTTLAALHYEDARALAPYRWIAGSVP